MRDFFRAALTELMTGSHLALLHRALMSDSVAIFMLHRFQLDGSQTERHSPGTLARFLGWLRRRKIPIWSLPDLVQTLRMGRGLDGGGVCFTVDDGYSDFATVGMDVFADFDCPVTVFLPTSFVDGECWMWWDKVEHMLRRTSESSVSVPAAAGVARPDRMSLTTPAAVRRAERRLGARLEVLDRDSLASALEELQADLRVTLPDRPPEAFSPLTWDQVRSCAARGASFGPHSRTHVRLSRASDREAEAEITGSWERLRTEVSEAVPIFCYPYGVSGSFGRRDARLVRSIGLRAALSSKPGVIKGRSINGTGPRLYSLPRFSFSNDAREARQVATGILKLRGLLQGPTG